MSRFSILPVVASSTLAVALFAATDPPSSSAASAGARVRPALLEYGNAVAVGAGRARSYVLRDEKTGAPVELGVALDERALDGLPAAGSGHHGAHVMTHEYILQLPARHATPFQFVELNWNPSGHEPEGVYQDVPHFDFHFYTIAKAERDSIVPENPKFAALANNVPAADYVPAFNVALGPPGVPPAGVAVPKMGVHWVDTRSPELQAMLGKPDAYRPFTKTFIHGSWNGRVSFWEPMITRAYILEKKTAADPAVRDEVVPIPMPKRYQNPGYYPDAYRIAWDPQAKEYRVALTGLAKRG
ncbi:MAG TPA: DUF5602 domain-containing protein [Gemmatimonadaceae bacterium]|nr:DUF5602 domain-containing protein [Gemmatimonadaceae bacterium]